MAFLSGVVIAISMLREREQQRRYMLTRANLHAQDDVQRILHNLFPEDVIEQLRLNRALVPRLHKRCGILWCDLVGFTPLSKRLGAEKLLELLNRIYSAFDALVELHGCVKIDTIGDAFVVLGGLFEDDEELEMQEDMQPTPVAVNISARATRAPAGASHAGEMSPMVLESPRIEPP